jgi:hypothetical protein
MWDALRPRARQLRCCTTFCQMSSPALQNACDSATEPAKRLRPVSSHHRAFPSQHLIYLIRPPLVKNQKLEITSLLTSCGHVFLRLRCSLLDDSLATVFPTFLSVFLRNPAPVALIASSCFETTSSITTCDRYRSDQHPLAELHHHSRDSTLSTFSTRGITPSVFPQTLIAIGPHALTISRAAFNRISKPGSAPLPHSTSSTCVP